MKKFLKPLALFTLILLSLSFVGWAVMVLKEPFLRKVLVTYFQSLFHSSTPEWKTYSSPNGGFSLESPFPLKWEPKELTTKSGKTFQSVWGISQVNSSGFLVSASCFCFPNKDHSFNSDKLQESIVLWPLQNSGYTEVKWESKLETCSGMPATLTTGSYSSQGDPYSFFELLIVDQNKYWTIHAQQKVGPVNFGELSSRIIQSIKIEPPKP